MPKVPREIKADVPFKELNAGDTKNALYNLLYELESGGTFATSGVYAEAPLPGLSLTGFGEIPLPLAERDACAILKKQAAINQGHIPTDKGAVGRLSICLPSKHLGGDLHARYGDKTKKVTTGPFSAFSYSYIAWYTNVTYEVKAVHSGYRLTLEYDIYQNSVEKSTVENLYSQKSKLKDLVTAWNNNVNKDKDKATRKSDHPTLLAYICDHEPRDEEALSIGLLQGQDLQRAQCLKEICVETGIGLYRAHLERTQSGFCDSHYGDENNEYHEIEHEDADSILLINMVHLNGSHVANSIAISEYDNFVQSDPFDNGPDKEDFDSQHGRVTHYYRMTVLVMIADMCKSEWLPEDKKGGRTKRKRKMEVIELE
ncbi:MAG: hypothetical protein Q9161_007091 [Pseudevernia consocians]